MALDGLTLGFVAREINSLLAGSRVDKVSQPDEDLLILHLRAQGQGRRLLLCATPGYARAHLTDKAYENPAQAPMFCMLARKHLQGGRFLGVEQLFGDRLLLFRFATLDELGDSGKPCSILRAWASTATSPWSRTEKSWTPCAMSPWT